MYLHYPKRGKPHKYWLPENFDGEKPLTGQKAEHPFAFSPKNHHFPRKKACECILVNDVTPNFSK